MGQFYFEVFTVHLRGESEQWICNLQFRRDQKWIWTFERTSKGSGLSPETLQLWETGLGKGDWQWKQEKEPWPHSREPRAVTQKTNREQAGVQLDQVRGEGGTNPSALTNALS